MILKECHANDFQSEQLRKDASALGTGDEIFLKASNDAGDEAFAVLSLLSDDDAELEKLLVPDNARKTGIGSRTLTAVEDYCRKRNIKILRLWANPLDDATDQQWLIGWYKRHGYTESGDGFAELEKTL